MRDHTPDEDRRMLRGSDKLSNPRLAMRHTFLSGMGVCVCLQATRAVERLAAVRTFIPRRSLHKLVKLWRGGAEIMRGRRRKEPWRGLGTIRGMVLLPEVGLFVIRELSRTPVWRGTSAAKMPHR